MAPNRKKKKPTSNPARGFATISTVSKSKVLDDEAADDAATSADTEPEHHILVPEKPAHESVAQKELHELSPDQLEARLEESELQLLVEKHGERCKKDVVRQVARLQTERRLLRSQALPLATSQWLPEELLQLIVDHVEQEKTQGSLPSSTNPLNDASRKSFSTDELSIKLWALRHALIDLGFLRSRVEDAIHHFVRNRRSIERAVFGNFKEGLWGIEDCLDWLAASCAPDELPDYENHRTEAIEKLQRQLASAPSAFDFSKFLCLARGSVQYRPISSLD